MIIIRVFNIIIKYKFYSTSFKLELLLSQFYTRTQWDHIQHAATLTKMTWTMAACRAAIKIKNKHFFKKMLHGCGFYLERLQSENLIGLIRPHEIYSNVCLIFTEICTLYLLSQYTKAQNVPCWDASAVKWACEMQYVIPTNPTVCWHLFMGRRVQCPCVHHIKVIRILAS